MTHDLAPSPPKPSTVLIVEDDELQRLILIDLLEERGYVVLTAGSALEAIRQIETHPEMRLVFTDIQLTGEIDGLDLLRVVHLRWPSLPLLTTSGRVRPHYAEMPSDTRFIAKPLQVNEMLKQMDELLAG